MADKLSSYPRLCPSRVSQFAWKEHRQGQTPTTPLASPSRSWVRKARTDTSDAPDEDLPAFNPSHAIENDGIRKHHWTRAQASTPLMSYDQPTDLHCASDDYLPTNPHNTPVSHRERPNEHFTSQFYSGKPRESSLSASKSSNISTYWPNYVSKKSRGSYAPNSTRIAWKPPRPPKPYFLTDAAFVVPTNLENTQPLANTSSVECKDIKPPPISHLVGHERHPQPHPRFVKHAFLKEDCASTIQRKQPESRGRNCQRYHPRPIVRRSAENPCPVSFDEADMPYPAPIPTIDRLPLRRPILSYESKMAFLRSQDALNHVPSKRIRGNTVLKRFTGLIWRVIGVGSFWQDQRESTTVTLSFYRFRDNPQTMPLSSLSYLLRMEVLAADSTRATDQILVSESSMNQLTCLAQIQLTLPGLFLNILKPFVMGIQNPVFTTVISIFICLLAILLRALARLSVRKLNRLCQNKVDLEEKESEY